MAGKRIKGITVEIDGSTTGLEKALKGVDSSISSTGESLRDVNRLLKLDPTNTELLEQKQKLLANSIEDTSKRLDTLKKANEDASKSIDNYDDWKRAFDPIQEEIDQTKSHAQKLREEMASMKEVGEIDTDAYKALQAELKDTNTKLKELREQAQEVSDEFGNPISPKQYDSLRREIIETEQKLQSLEKESAETSAALEAGFKKAANETVPLKKAISDIGDNIKNGVILEASEQLSRIGDKLTELGGAATESFNEINNANTKAAAYFGETGEAAEDTAQVIKAVYEGGVGDSMDTVSDAVIAVKQNFRDLDQTELTNLTNQAIILEELYGIDMNETLRGASSLMKNFGMSGQEAMDFIVAGTQNGLDKTNELGDNLSEYSGKFSQAGYSAQEYFQLLNNGLDGGAYNLDKVNDAINEVTTRLADGTVADNIGIYSDKTQELFQKWQDGGATQKEVIDSIVSDIANTTNEQDALNQAAQAFGTMAEDGNLKFITSLTSVGNTYDDVSGKAQGMFDATSTPAQEMESNMRKLKDSLLPLGEQLMELANAIIPPLVEGVQKVADFFGNLPTPIQNFIAILGGLIAAFTALAPVIRAVVTIIGAFGAATLGPIIGIIAGVAAAIAGIIAIIQNWGSITQWFGDVWDSICSGIGSLVESLKGWFSDLWNHIQNVWNGICNAVQVAVMFLGSIIQGAVQIITLPFQMIWENCKGVVISAWNMIKSAVSTAIQAVSGVISSVMGTIQSIISSIWSAISSRVSVAVNSIKNVVTTIFNAIKSVTSSVWNGIKTAISTVVDGIKSKVSSIFNAVKSTVTSVFNGIKSTATSVWNGIKNAITKPVEEAKNKVKGIVDKISGFFSGMKLQLPKIKLPHFKISGKLSLAPPSVPKLEIAWYKKAMDRAMVMDTPTLFGYDAKTNKLLAGGEAGREVVSGEEHLLSMIGKVVQSQYSQMGSQLDQLNSLVQQYFPQVLQNMGHDIVFDDGTLVGRLTPKVDDRLSRIQRHKERGN